MTILTGSIQLARDTEANWTAANPVLLAGAIYVSTNVFYGATNSPKFKIGNGVSNWVATDYHPDASGLTINTTGVTGANSGNILYAAGGALRASDNLQYTGSYFRLTDAASGEKLRLAYDGSNYVSFSVSASGLLTITPVGTSTTITLASPLIARVRPRTLVTNAPGATPSTDTDALDFKHFTGLNTAITSMTTNLTGTPTEAQKLWLAFTPDASNRAITWGSGFENGAGTLPLLLLASTRYDVGLIWNTVTSKWRCMAAG